MQQNLIDAARAVISADHAGELTDELINALEAAVNAETAGLMSTQWWLAELDQYGSPKLVDGDHTDMAGANRALYLINALGLGAGRKYAAAKVQLFEAVPDGRGVNQGAIRQINRTRLERGHD